jgi:hypothetical protein
MLIREQQARFTEDAESTPERILGAESARDSIDGARGFRDSSAIQIDRGTCS